MYPIHKVTPNYGQLLSPTTDVNRVRTSQVVDEWWQWAPVIVHGVWS